MYILCIIVAFAAGIGLGCLAMYLAYTRRENKLERYQAELDYYRMELDREKYHLDHDWDCPITRPGEKEDGKSSYRRIIINK